MGKSGAPSPPTKKDTKKHGNTETFAASVGLR